MYWCNLAWKDAKFGCTSCDRKLNKLSVSASLQ
jgi:hypothetical protein